MPPEPRRPLGAVPPVPHGGLPLAELARRGIRPQDVLDFSVSVHPLGPSAAVRRAAAAALLEQYPDPATGALRRVLAARHGVAEERIWVGNGASELLWLAAHAYLAPGDRALVLGPTYGEYRRAAALAGATVADYCARVEDEFHPDPAAIARLAARERPRLIFACTPNNPTGVALDAADLARLADLAAELDALLVLDAAYAGFAADATAGAALRDRPHVLLVHSMTKDHGIPGLRLGYAVGAAEVVGALRALAPPWSVNAVAQAAGLAALADDAHLAAGRTSVRVAGDLLRGELARLGLTLRPSAANFWLVEVGDAALVRSALLERGILVRDCASFGLPRFIRIAARPPEDCARLVAALAEIGSPARR